MPLPARCKPSRPFYSVGSLPTGLAIPYRLGRSSNRVENSSTCRESNPNHSALSRVLSGALSSYIYEDKEKGKGKVHPRKCHEGPEGE
jgi:hypothetical protein